MGTSGLIMQSRNDEMRLVGPLQPLTMGLFPCLVKLRKYMHWVLTFSWGSM